MAADLNAAQTKAVRTAGGPLLILGGPGTGKTMVVAHRIAYLLAEKQLPPWQILAVTFNDLAARKMRSTVQGLVDIHDIEGMALGTFHATCARILRVDGGADGVDPHFTIYDTDDQLALMKRVVLDIGVDQKRYHPRAILGVISKAKNELVSPAAYARAVEDYFQEVVARAYARYQELLDESRALDFDDLLLRTVRLFERNGSILHKYQQCYLQVMVDGLENTDTAQYALIRQIARGHNNIWAAGDVDESIYSFRTADYRNILNFEQDFPGVEVVWLEQNYRSTQTILDSALGVIERNRRRHDKSLWTENGAGVPVMVYEAEDAEDEARFVCDEVRAAVREGRWRPKDFSVIYRTAAQSRAFEEAMTKAELPYQVVGSARFWGSVEIKDLLAYLSLVRNPFDAVSLKRIINVPDRGLSAGTWEKLARGAGARGVPVYAVLQMLVEGRGEAPREITGRALSALVRFVSMLNDLIEEAPGLTPPQLLREIIDRSGYRAYLRARFDDDAKRWENVQRLIIIAQQYDGLPTDSALVALLEHASLAGDLVLQPQLTARRS